MQKNTVTVFQVLNCLAFSFPHKFLTFFDHLVSEIPLGYYQVAHDLLVGGSNPFEKITKWEFSPNRGENNKIIETTTWLKNHSKKVSPQKQTLPCCKGCHTRWLQISVFCWRFDWSNVPSTSATLIGLWIFLFSATLQGGPRVDRYKWSDGTPFLMAENTWVIMGV